MGQCLKSVAFTRIQRFKHQMKRHCRRMQLEDTVDKSSRPTEVLVLCPPLHLLCCLLDCLGSQCQLTNLAENNLPRTKLMWKRKQEKESTIWTTCPLRSFGVQSISHLNQKCQRILPASPNLNNILHLLGKSWLLQSGWPQPPISCRLLENHYLGHL